VKQEQEGKAHLAQEVEQARDGNAMVQVGTQLVAYGQVDQGIDLLEKGIAKAQLRKPADAKLRLGLAQLKKNKAKGLQTLRSVQGSDGVADIARLYAILAGQS